MKLQIDSSPMKRLVRDELVEIRDNEPTLYSLLRSHLQELACPKWSREAWVIYDEYRKNKTINTVHLPTLLDLVTIADEYKDLPFKAAVVRSIVNKNFSDVHLGDSPFEFAKGFLGAMGIAFEVIDANQCKIKAEEYKTIFPLGNKALERFVKKHIVK